MSKYSTWLYGVCHLGNEEDQEVMTRDLWAMFIVMGAIVFVAAMAIGIGVML